MKNGPSGASEHTEPKKRERRVCIKAKMLHKLWKTNPEDTKIVFISVILFQKQQIILNLRFDRGMWTLNEKQVGRSGWGGEVM